MSSDEPGAAPAIAVIVLSHRWRNTLVAAVRSLVAQDTQAEVVVAHSGGGDPRAELLAAGLDVRVVTSEARLFPGGARNLGIAATTAPFVAFLADDCTAEPGWVRERVRLHQEGEVAVASALLCHKPSNPVALAAHLSLFVRRMPRTDPAVALKYGASYARVLFERYGLFRDDIEGGEDTEFHRRLAAPDKPVWRPQVQTVHSGAESLIEFLSSQFRRGRRIAQAWREMGEFSGFAVAKNAIERTGQVIGEGFKVVESRQRWAVAAAAPLVIIGNIVYAWGALTAGRAR